MTRRSFLASAIAVPVAFGQGTQELEAYAFYGGPHHSALTAIDPKPSFKGRLLVVARSLKDDATQVLNGVVSYKKLDDTNVPDQTTFGMGNNQDIDWLYLDVPTLDSNENGDLLVPSKVEFSKMTSIPIGVSGLYTD